MADNRELRPHQIITALRTGRLSRRDFMIRAAALGFSASAINAFLIACGGDAATSTVAPSVAPSAAGSAAPSAAASAAASAAPSASAAASASGAATTPATGGTPGAAASPTRAASPGTPSAAGTPGTFTRENPPAVANASEASQYSGQQVTYVGGQVGSDADFDQILTAKFTEDTGIQVNLIPGPPSATERYAQYQRTFQGQSADIDVMMIDVIWPAAFAPFLVDLSPKLGDLAQMNVESIIENNTVDGKLVGMPWFGDFGILYYRTDLMEKYNIAAPPTTWQELQEQAQQIQEGEVGANANFAGFVFQGNAYEGLTCNALEWFASNGAGQFIEDGQVTINSPEGVVVLDLLKSYIGTVSPRGVTTFQESETAQAFTNGNAAFARNWPYMYAIAEGADSAVMGNFDVTALPAGEGQDPAGTLGGWQLGVSSFSQAQDAAIEFVRYMCGPDVVTWRGVVGSYVPLQPEVTDNPAVQQAQPYLANLADVTRVVRPSNALGENYNQGSTIIYQAINQVLNGADSQQQLQSAQSQLERLVR